MPDGVAGEGRLIAEGSDVLEPDAVHEVLVVDAGLIGSSIAWLLSKAGCRVVLIDAGSFGGEASAAGAGMLAPGGEYGEPSPAARFAIESLAMYPTFVRQLEKESGLSIDYRKCGRLNWHMNVSDGATCGNAPTSSGASEYRLSGYVPRA